MTRLLLVIGCLAFMATASAEDKPLIQEVWKEVLRKGAEGARAVKNVGKPRVVPKGATPEIIIKKDEIRIDDKPLTIGESLEQWKKNIPEKPVCDSKPPRILCVWDRLGLQVLTQSVSNPSVVEFKIYLHLEQLHPYGVATHRPDGTPRPPPQDTRPKHPFPGYLELDGYGIDAKSQFWEIRAGSDPWRELRCGVRDCAHPHGAFSDSATLYLRLNKSTEYGNVYELSISSWEDFAPQSTAPAK